jgi:cytochrome c oxidase subunit 2
LPLIITLAAVLSGCSAEQASRGFLPGTAGITNHTDAITNLWNASWIVLYGVGIIAWGLMAYALVRYRRRNGEAGLPPQLRYNMPIETLFTVVPFVLVIGFFAFTVRDMTAIEKPVASDVKIEVVGKQWSWDFNYLTNDVYDVGIQAKQVGNSIDYAALPTLYLPVNKSVEIDLRARDVIHSFWVIDFLYKKDVFPGRTNKMYFTPQKVGTYQGKCAELCGEFHSMMLFTVKVVPQAEYDAHVAELAARGQTGSISDEYNRDSNLPGDNPSIRG